MRTFYANDKDKPRKLTLPVRRNWSLRAEELFIPSRGGKTYDAIVVLADNGRVTIRRISK